ncbi:hypothetical protein HC864_04125 [Candidatus Gracilibacteria bacterium]|nr:hypothetical protein [Candidatus Gracilibacteria bacterium]
MLQALIFDSFYDKHRGVIAYIRIFSGEIKKRYEYFFSGYEYQNCSPRSWGVCSSYAN